MGGLVANAQNADAGVKVPDTHRTALSTSYDIIDHDGNNIGFIQNFTQSQNRNVTPVRHLNSADAGRIIEGAPSPATSTISVNGFAIYNKQNNGSIIQRLGGSVTAKAMVTLEEQSVPFNIVKTVTHPATGDVLRKIVYHDCWLTQHSEPVNIANALVAESANIFVGWVGQGAA